MNSPGWPVDEPVERGVPVALAPAPAAVGSSRMVGQEDQV
jgi:hypothetical protein